MIDYDDAGQIVAFGIQGAHAKAEMITRLLGTLPGPITFVVHGTEAGKVSELLNALF